MKKANEKTLAELGIVKAPHAGMCCVCGTPIYAGDLIRLTENGERAQHATHSYGNLEDHLADCGGRKP